MKHPALVTMCLLLGFLVVWFSLHSLRRKNESGKPVSVDEAHEIISAHKKNFAPKPFLNVFMPPLRINLTQTVYFVHGEVEQPNFYSFRSNLTILDGVKEAGGFTVFADPSRVEFRWPSGKTEVADLSQPETNSVWLTPVLPNFRIYVPGRRLSN